VQWLDLNYIKGIITKMKIVKQIIIHKSRMSVCILNLCNILFLDFNRELNYKLNRFLNEEIFF
jgi:hypothetical protein